MLLKISLLNKTEGMKMVSVGTAIQGKLNNGIISENVLPWLPPLVAGGFMLTASILPWLRDPLGKTYTAWNITLDSAWLGHSTFLNYGLLCLMSTVYVVAGFVYALRDRSRLPDHYLAHWRSVSALLCIVPVLLFLLQYLCVDVSAMALLANHKTQLLLIQQRFGYTLPPPLLPLQPFTLTTATVAGRFQLLLEQMSFGPPLLCVSASIVIAERRWNKRLSQSRIKNNGNSVRFVVIPALVIFIITATSAPLSTLCIYESTILLSSGNYSDALLCLSLAHFLNPQLEQTAYFHVARGQALYFLFPSRSNADGRAYLASMYRSQKDYLDAYYELLPSWQESPNSPWLVDEISVTLESLAEENRPLKRISGKSVDNDRTALLWLGLLAQVDPTNVYAQYTAARINYDLHNQLACTQDMQHVLRLSSNADIASSAYTYLALSNNDVGNYSEARTLLLLAVALDPNYRNNVAREELSGLH